MSLTIYGDKFESGELSNTTRFQSITPRENLVLSTVKTWIIVVNDPTFSSLQMKLYLNDRSSGDNSPSTLKASSSILLKSQIISDNSGWREVYFNFDNISLQAGTTYNLVVNGSGYVPTSSSFLAWQKGWPNPVYDINYTANAVNLGIAPYNLSVIGAVY